MAKKFGSLPYFKIIANGEFVGVLNYLFATKIDGIEIIHVSISCINSDLLDICKTEFQETLIETTVNLEGEQTVIGKIYFRNPTKESRINLLRRTAESIGKEIEFQKTL